MTEPTYFDLIHSAMTDRRVIQVKVNHTWRTVEPYITGLQSGTKQPCLLVFCRDQLGENRWRVFTLAEIDALELTYYGFDPHPDYQGQSLLFAQVYKRVPFSQVVADYEGYPVRPSENR